MTLLSAPIDLAGDWGASTPEDALIVLSRTREVSLTGVSLLSDNQPATLRVESRPSGPPHVWLQSSTQAHVVVDGTARDWCRMIYQFGHELGHVLSNSWQPDSLPLRPSQWLEEVLVEAFTFRSLALVADSWEQDSWLPGETGYSKDLRRYREFLIGGYRNGAAGSKQWLNGWFADARAAVESNLGGRAATGPALLMVLGELVRDKGCVEDLAALNRWRDRAAASFEDYLRLWGESCTELGTPGRLPRRLRQMLYPDENPRPSLRPPEPYIHRPRRGEVRQHAAALDDLLPLEHPVRTVWALAEALDLQGALKPSIATAASAAPVQPALLLALWLWATAEGIGSARQLERLCTEHLAFRWLCGGVEINGQTLRDFRLIHGDAFDKLLAHSLAVLDKEGVIKLEMVSLDAEKSQVLEGAKAARGRESLKARAILAAARVQELRTALDRDDPIADERHERAARWRVAQQQGIHVNAALAQMKELSRTRPQNNEGQGQERKAARPEIS
jgi:transposase